MRGLGAISWGIYALRRSRQRTQPLTASRSLAETRHVETASFRHDLVEVCSKEEPGTGILQRVHSVVHGALAASSLVAVPSAVDAWTCVLDTHAAVPSLGVNQARPCMLRNAHTVRLCRMRAAEPCGQPGWPPFCAVFLQAECER